MNITGTRICSRSNTLMEGLSAEFMTIYLHVFGKNIMQYYRINFNKSSLSRVQYKVSKGGLYVKDQCRYSFIPKLPTFKLEATWRKNKTSTGLIKWRKLD